MSLGRRENFSVGLERRAFDFDAPREFVENARATGTTVDDLAADRHPFNIEILGELEHFVCANFPVSRQADVTRLRGEP